MNYYPAIQDIVASAAREMQARLEGFPAGMTDPAGFADILTITAMDSMIFEELRRQKCP